MYDARFVLKKIDKDLAVVMNDFWNGPVGRRTCKKCGCVIQRAGTIEIKKGKVRAAAKTGATAPPGRKKAKKRAAGKAGR